jgi:uncharacterized protein
VPPDATHMEGPPLPGPMGPPRRLGTVRDSIHRSIPLEPFVFDLLSTAQLQRLRRIRQLGGVHLVYPGANHSRFEHALGAYALARKAAETLAMDREDALVVMAGALLHDVGHGPFSHTSDEFLNEAGRRHEDLSVDLVRWSTIANVLDRHEIPVDRVVDAIEGKGSLGDLVAGDLDVDRMDYLMRDAFYTGVRMSVDTDRILTGLVMSEDAIALDERSLAAAESLLVTRFMMYPSVYMHHTCRSIERMITCGVRQLFDNGTLSVQDLERLDDAKLLMRMEQGPGEAAEIAQRLDERRLYKRAIEGNLHTAQETKGMMELSQDPKRRQGLEQAIAERAGVAAHHVLIDVPPTRYMKETGLKVLMRDGSMLPLPEASSLISALEHATADHWRFWVFTPKRHQTHVAQAAIEELGLQSTNVRITTDPQDA